METDRFAPPRAQVNDIQFASDGYQPVRFWPPSGRIGRLRMLAYGFGLYVLFIIFGALVGGVIGAAGAASGGNTALSIAVGLLSLVAVVFYCFASIVILIQRCHDMNMSGWWTFAAFIPLAMLFWLINPGTAGANRWGAPPPPNGLAVKIFGWFFPALIVIGMVVAIALPVYMQATGRDLTSVPR